MTTFFETGLGVSAYLVYVKGIPYVRSRATLTYVPGGQRIDAIDTYPWARRILKLILGKAIIRYVPNRWWVRLLAFEAACFCIIFVVAERILLSQGWRNPFASSVSGQGLTMNGFLFDLAFSRSNNQPNGAHLVSYIGIPLIALSVIYIEVNRFLKDPNIRKGLPDMSFGLLIAAFYVAIHEGPWETAYYIEYAQYLSWQLITNVLKDVSFTSMIVLFVLAFWKYPYRKISMKAFTPVVVLYIGMIVAWFIVPSFYGYGFMPITTINNFLYGKGVYSETQWWANPTINLIEVFSWLGLYLMMQYVTVKDLRL